jgi:putative ABC transport system substrate-binding protein
MSKGAYRDFTRAGGLMSYGSDLADAYRRVGGCVARILKGETPGGIPVTQSIKERLTHSASKSRSSLSQSPMS